MINREIEIETLDTLGAIIFYIVIKETRNLFFFKTKILKKSLIL